MTKMKMAKLAVICFFLGNSPDLDVLVTLFRPDLFLWAHRFVGHNLFFMLFWAWVGTKLFRYFVNPLITNRTAWTFSLLLVFSHVVLDACGDWDKYGMKHGAPLLWPLTDWEFVLPLRLFKAYAWSRQVHPLVAHATSVEYWVGCALNEMLVVVVTVTSWWLGVLIRKALKKAPLNTPLIDNVENEPQRAVLR